MYLQSGQEYPWQASSHFSTVFAGLHPRETPLQAETQNFKNNVDKNSNCCIKGTLQFGRFAGVLHQVVLTPTYGVVPVALCAGKYKVPIKGQ